MTQPQPTQVNLNPAQAVPSMVSQPIRLGALKAESTRGTEQASFRIPLHMKSLINMVMSSPVGHQFQGVISNFYLLAVARLLQEQAPFFRHDMEYTKTIQSLERLSQVAEYEEPIEDFKRRMEKAERLADVCVQTENYALGLTLLREAVGTVQDTYGVIRTALETELRRSKPIQALTAALVAEETYGLTSEVDRLQKFMGGSL